jgi:integrase
MTTAPVDAVDLASLRSPASQRTMAAALTTAARLLTRRTHVQAPAIAWHRLRYPHVARLQAALQRRYAPATAAKILVAVRRVLAEARKLRLIAHEDFLAATELPPIRLPARPPVGRDISLAELGAMFKTIEAQPSPIRERDLCMMALLVGCGLRRAEVVGLDVTDYDTGAGRLTVHGKGGVTREVYARHETRAAIEGWLAVRGAVLAPLLLPVDRHRVIRSHRLSTTAVYARFLHFAKATPHDARRTFVGNLLDAGADLAVVQQLAGHKSPTTTARYDRRGARARERAAELVRLPLVMAR